MGPLSAAMTLTRNLATENRQIGCDKFFFENLISAITYEPKLDEATIEFRKQTTLWQYHWYKNEPLKWVLTNRQNER